MRAAVIEAFGPPEVLRVAELPNPKASHNQLLIRVSACGVNRRDTWVRAGLRSQSLPRILGCDIAGTVVAAGPGSRQERIGESVVVYPIVSCGWCSHCITGNDQLCASAGLLGAEADGGYCELIAVDESRVFPAPPSLDPMQAAALPIVYTTAWQMIRRTRIAPGETVLIWGASSGLGRAALELTRLVNPGRTFTTARRDKVDRAAGLGADAVIAYDREPVAERILELTDGHGVDVIVDHVGSAAWPVNLAVAARGARIAVAGATTGDDVSLALLPFLFSGHEIHGCFVGSRQDFTQVLRLAGEGLIAPEVESIPLAEAAEAHRRIESGDSFGKLVLACA